MTQQIQINLSASLDITQVESLRASLADGLEQDLPILMDAGEVERVDAAALQLLCAFLVAAREAGLECTWEAVSPALQDGARLTGLEACLYLPQAT